MILVNHNLHTQLDLVRFRLWFQFMDKSLDINQKSTDSKTSHLKLEVDKWVSYICEIHPNTYTTHTCANPCYRYDAPAVNYYIYFMETMNDTIFFGCRFCFPIKFCSRVTRIAYRLSGAIYAYWAWTNNESVTLLCCSAAWKGDPGLNHKFDYIGYLVKRWDVSRH